VWFKGVHGDLDMISGSINCEISRLRMDGTSDSGHYGISTGSGKEADEWSGVSDEASSSW